MRAALLSIASLLLAVGPALAPTAARAEDAPKAVTDAERDASIDKAVRFLDAGVMKLPLVHGTPRRPFVVATYGVVKLLHGDRERTRTSSRGNKELGKIAAFLVDYVDDVESKLDDPLQLPAQHGRAVSGGVIQYNWPLAVAAIFFAELHARGKHEALALRTNQKIVNILLDSQQENGGWGHGRVRDMLKATGLDKEMEKRLKEELEKAVPGAKLPKMDGYPSTLIATTNLVGLALGLVQRAHGSDPFGDEFEPALERAVEYFDDAQLVSGLFPYDPSQRSAGGDKTGIPRSGGAIAALLALGVAPRTKEVRRAADTVDEGLDYLSEGHGSATLGLWLSAQGMHLRGAAAWARFKAAYFRQLLDAQADTGHFACICEGRAFGATNDDRPIGVGAVDRATRLYVTALTTWILLLDRTRLRTGPLPPDAPGPDATTTR